MRPTLSLLSSLACFAALAAGVLVPRNARADDDTTSDGDSSKEESPPAGPHGFEAGVRLGYALPMGQITGSGTNPALSNFYSGMVPLWFDVGYRASPHFYIGGYFQYGFAFIGPLSGTSTGVSPCSTLDCSGNILAGGLDARYHVQPEETFDPWVGLGIGYEVANFTMSQGNSSGTLSFNGFQFLNLSLGGDLRASRSFAVGPYAMLSFGEYSTCGTSGAASSLNCNISQTALHEWLSFGVRASFDTSP